MSKPIYIFALHGVRTGGPEATHQLSDALLSQGFDARMVYFDRPQIGALLRSPIGEGYRFGARSNTIEDYACYRTEPAAEAPNAPGNVIVLPETLLHLTPYFDKATVLIWWLSVDNAFAALSQINLNHLRKPNVFHAAQSQYANRFIVSLGLTPAAGAFLTDYTVDLRAYATPLPMAERPKLVAFNATPHKVIADLDAIIAQVRAIDSEIECVRVQGMDRCDLATLFATARVYVDLGNFPGKDRMPREALSMGCSPLTARVGAGREFMSTCVNPLDERDVVLKVCARISAISRMANEPEPPPAPNFERSQFHREAKAVFSDL